MRTRKIDIKVKELKKKKTPQKSAKKSLKEAIKKTKSTTHCEMTRKRTNKNKIPLVASESHIAASRKKIASTHDVRAFNNAYIDEAAVEREKIFIIEKAYDDAIALMNVINDQEEN